MELHGLFESHVTRQYSRVRDFRFFSEQMVRP